MNEYQATRKEKQKARESAKLDTSSDSLEESASTAKLSSQSAQKLSEVDQQTQSQPKVIFEIKTEAVETPLSEENSLMNTMNTSDKIPEKSDQDVSSIQVA